MTGINNKVLQYLDDVICAWMTNLDNMIPPLIADMKTSTKKNRFDLVTNVDKQIQNQFENFLNEHFPTHYLLGEEKNNQFIHEDIEHLWIMDPIDGTANLVKQQEDYCIILAYFVNGEPSLSYIYDYPRGVLYKAIKGQGAFANGQPLLEPKSLALQDAIVSFNPQVINIETVQMLLASSFSYRLIGACGLDSIRVIKGQFGAHVNTNPKPWDIAAQFLFAEELGLKMTNLTGQPINHLQAGPFIISNPSCHQEVLDILNSHGGYQK
ncbi:inositol monophosphatase family protein [Staphylococcus simiae]|nr:inositol monophosphatase family protein [Staphylococcus simiae]